MQWNAFKATCGRLLKGRKPLQLPRLMLPLWGTMTWADSLVGLGYLVWPFRLVRGPAITALEEAFARKVGVSHAVTFSAGRVGLYAILRGLGIGAGDEVLLHVPTHIVVPDAIRYTGATPVFVDCNPSDYNMDLQHAENQVTPRTKAIVLQHTFGIPVDMDAALALAKRHGLAVVEDCVHALGATYGGRPVGSLGTAAFFSMEETKVISSMMGGVAVTDDPHLAAALRSFQATCGWPSTSLAARYVTKLVLYHVLGQPTIAWLFYPLISSLRRANWVNIAPTPTTEEEQLGLKPNGYEQRLSNAQAAMALRQLSRLDSNLKHRRRIAELYRTRLSAQATLPLPSPKAEPTYLRFPLWAEDRPSAIRRTAGSMAAGLWFTSVLEESETPQHGGYRMNSCPIAESAAGHLINLPTHLRVTERDAERIVQSLTGVRLRRMSVATDHAAPTSFKSGGPD